MRKSSGPVEKFTFASDRADAALLRQLADLDAQIRDLGRTCQMPASFIGLDYQTEPSFFTALNAFGNLHDLVLIQPRGFAALAGLGIRSVRRAYLGGQATDIGYLHHLRFHPDIRGGSFLLRGYRAFREIFADRPLPVTLTSILEENHYARQLLETERAGGGMPVYQPVSRYLTALIPLSGPGRRWPQKYRSQQPGTLAHRMLQNGDLPALVALFERAGRRNEGAPYIDRLESDGSLCGFFGLRIDDMVGVFAGDELVGAIGVWNQQHYRQIVVHHLCRPLVLAQKFWQSVEFMAGRCPVPAVGGQVDFVLLDPWAAEPGLESMVMPVLIRAACEEAKKRGAMFAAFGMAEKFPALAALNTVFFLPYWSIIYQVFWPETGKYEFAGRPLHLANLGAL